MEYYLLLLSFSYFILHLIFLTGLLKSGRLKKSVSENNLRVSVIVAAKNEKDNIVNCISSLREIDYPDDMYEVILVNDNSSDNTYELMKDASAGKNNFFVINSSDPPTGNLKGKANAIDTAIKMCKGDVIVSTDADCIVRPDWLSEISSYYDEKTGMVCGFTCIMTGESWFYKLQNLDWMYLLSLASSSSGLNMILSCIGNNLSFTKSSYLEVGGYESINFSVTEDLALMRKINSSKKFIIKFPLSKNALVNTLPCINLKELFSQKRRWFRGGTGINFLGYITGVELYSMNLILVAGLFFLNIKFFLVIIFIKTLSELMLMIFTLNRFKMTDLLVYYPFYMLYMAFYGILLPITFIFGTKINWKGQKF